MRLSLRPARPGGGPSPALPPSPGSHGASHPSPPPPGKASRVGVRRSHAEGKSRAGSSWEVVFRGGGTGGTGLGSERGLGLCVGVGMGVGAVGVQGTGHPRVWQAGYPSAGSPPGGGGNLPTAPPQGFKEGKIILRERSAGARRWLRADGSGTSKVISSSNIAFLTHMVKSAWRQLGEVPVVTSV